MALLALLPITAAQATGYLTSFQITNCLQGTNWINSYPTNSIGTNGMTQNTGRGLAIGNVEHFGLQFEGYLVNTNPGAGNLVTFQLVGSGGSPANGSPTVTIGTNNFSANGNVISANDWTVNTNNSWLVVVQLPPLYTNWFTWATNYSSSSGPLVDLNYVGVGGISNVVAAGCVFTNTALYLNTKLIPSPLIGQ